MTSTQMQSSPHDNLGAESPHVNQKLTAKLVLYALPMQQLYTCVDAECHPATPHYFYPFSGLIGPYSQ